MQRTLTSAGSVFICFISFSARCTHCICWAGMCLRRRTPLACCLCSFCVCVTAQRLWLITSCSPRACRASRHLLASSPTIQIWFCASCRVAKCVFTVILCALIRASLHHRVIFQVIFFKIFLKVFRLTNKKMRLFSDEMPRPLSSLAFVTASLFLNITRCFECSDNSIR